MGCKDAPKPEVYLPYTITSTGPRGIMVSTAGNSSLILEAFDG